MIARRATVGRPAGTGEGRPRFGGRRLLPAGDASDFRADLVANDQPVSQNAARRTDDGPCRASLRHLRWLVRGHGGEVDVVGNQDPTGLAAGHPLP